MCDVRRVDILAGIQLIVHQSGLGCHAGFNTQYSRQMTTAARHSRPQKQHLPTMSDALGMEISDSIGFTAHFLCCKRMPFPLLVSMHAVSFSVFFLHFSFLPSFTFLFPGCFGFLSDVFGCASVSICVYMFFYTCVCVYACVCVCLCAMLCVNIS